MSIARMVLIVAFLMGLSAFFTGLYGIATAQNDFMYASLAGLGAVICILNIGVFVITAGREEWF